MSRWLAGEPGETRGDRDETPVPYRPMRDQRPAQYSPFAKTPGSPGEEWRPQILLPANVRELSETTPRMQGVSRQLLHAQVQFLAVSPSKMNSCSSLK